MLYYEVALKILRAEVLVDSGDLDCANIPGMSHTAPFSPWNFREYLSLSVSINQIEAQRGGSRSETKKKP